MTRCLFLFCLGLLAALAGCATTINKEHPMIVTQPDVAAANVYFIRPMTYRERGIADNPVVIELNGMEMLKLGKGEYTLLRVRPEKALLKTRNWTAFTNKDEYVEMTRELRLELAAGKTYFIHIRQVNEEFRGVYYVPMLVDLKTAKELILDSGPTLGGRSAPIDALSP
ncbi:MAG: hypothetical protein HY273_03585 [Gammaproteobacteria bacterium]|nr:hypothetical protein [Gammaproteobacteria bacterium]